MQWAMMPGSIILALRDPVKQTSLSDLCRDVLETNAGDVGGGPGQRFRYTSRAILQTPVGVMEGAYTLLNTYTQRAFDVPVSPFRLAVPRQLH